MAKYKKTANQRDTTNLENAMRILTQVQSNAENNFGLEKAKPIGIETPQPGPIETPPHVEVPGGDPSVGNNSVIEAVMNQNQNAVPTTTHGMFNLKQPPSTPEYPQEDVDSMKKAIAASSIGQGLGSIFNAVMGSQGVHIPEPGGNVAAGMIGELGKTQNRYWDDYKQARDEAMSVMDYNLDAENKEKAVLYGEQKEREQREADAAEWERRFGAQTMTSIEAREDAQAHTRELEQIRLNNLKAINAIKDKGVRDRMLIEAGIDPKDPQAQEKWAKKKSELDAMSRENDDLLNYATLRLQEIDDTLNDPDSYRLTDAQVKNMNRERSQLERLNASNIGVDGVMRRQLKSDYNKHLQTQADAATKAESMKSVMADAGTRAEMHSAAMKIAKDKIKGMNDDQKANELLRIESNPFLTPDEKKELSDLIKESLK
jgi:hypothetical protein